MEPCIKRQKIINQITITFTELIGDYKIGKTFIQKFDSGIILTEMKLRIAEHYNTTLLYVNLQLPNYDKTPDNEGYQRTTYCHNLKQEDIHDNMKIYVQIFTPETLYGGFRMQPLHEYYSSAPFRTTLTQEDINYFKKQNMKPLPDSTALSISAQIDFYDPFEKKMGKGRGAWGYWSSLRFFHEETPRETVKYEFKIDPLMSIGEFCNFVLDQIVADNIVDKSAIKEFWTKYLHMNESQSMETCRHLMKYDSTIPMINISGHYSKIKFGCYAIKKNHIRLIFNYEGEHVLNIDKNEPFSELSKKLFNKFLNKKISDCRYIAILKDDKIIDPSEIIGNVYQQNELIKCKLYDGIPPKLYTTDELYAMKKTKLASVLIYKQIERSKYLYDNRQRSNDFKFELTTSGSSIIEPILVDMFIANSTPNKLTGSHLRIDITKEPFSVHTHEANMTTFSEIIKYGYGIMSLQDSIDNLPCLLTWANYLELDTLTNAITIVLADAYVREHTERIAKL
jgi:hypothetical protein